ncbi:MAG: cobyric acid synthase [Burkholderiales bacterium]|nr:cobyric acid synthase [Burkholderiales bacterium]
MARTLIVWGCSSGAGKSLLATAICRWAANQGLRVAPFKAQNMSNNARLVPTRDGGCGEIGSAQYFQALAARAPAQVDFNPVLLKPESDTASQVLVHGRVRADLGRMPWRERSHQLAQAARESFERVASAHELVVVEGAGSPAEINLAEHDFVNLGVARWARELGPTQALLVADIDRGGAFAHLHGSWALLPPDLRPLLVGFILNKFRGDAALLAPGPQQLQQLTGVPLLGVLPMLRAHGLPEEDGVQALPPVRGAATRRVAVLAPPALSNLDEFQPLQQLASVQLVWVREPGQLAGADWIVLPGSKQVRADLAWLRARGLEAPIREHARLGRPLLGLCGGLQMLGEWLDDPLGLEGSAPGRDPGLGLLPLRTHYALPKRLLPGQLRFGCALGAWQALTGLAFEGYEIRCGHSESAACAVLHAADGQATGWQRGNVLGVYGHGLFEAAAVQQALFGETIPPVDLRFDELARSLEAALGSDTLHRLTAI